LFETMDHLLAGGLRRLRIHSRAPITAPSRVTDALVAGLAARQPLRVVVHCNHPAELAPDVDAALARLINAGVQVLNQAVLLAGVNDDVDTLDALLSALIERGVTPYYLHHPDAVSGNAHLRVDPRRGVALVEALRARRADVPRYVVDPPDGTGKIDVAAWLAGSVSAAAAPPPAPGATRPA
jgi:lysine 2,3-aminomutase